MRDDEAGKDQRRRSGYIDLLRGVAILGVVAIHFGGSFATPANAWTPSFRVGLVLNQALQFSVPLFLFLAGYLSFSGSDASRQGGLWDYYRGRLARIALPYLVVSAVSLVLFGHLSKLHAMASTYERIWWLLSRLLFFGVEGTLYFIPLIMQLYLLQPLLKALPTQVSRLLGSSMSASQAAAALTIGFVIIHALLAVLSFRGAIDYYVWARPNALFWMVYFFAGMQLRAFGLQLSRATKARAAIVLLALAAGCMAWNIARLFDRQIVGAGFTSSMIDWTYVVPLVVVFNLTFVAGASLGLEAGWKVQSATLERFGKASLSIYLWHIIALYVIAWRNPPVLEACRELPEIIPVIAFATAWSISAVGMIGRGVVEFFHGCEVRLDVRRDGLLQR